MKTRTILLLTALSLTGWLSFWGPEADQSVTVSEPSPRREQPGRPTKVRSGVARSENNVQLPVLRPRQAATPVSQELLERAPPIFYAQSWDPPQPVQKVAVDLPKAPPLPYTYLGKQLDDGRWLVWLALGEEVRSVQAGQLLDGNYRIDEIAPPWLRLTYLPLKEAQSINIGAL